MFDKKNQSPEAKEQLPEAVRMRNVKRNIKIRCVGKIAWEKVIEKLKFVENV